MFSRCAWFVVVVVCCMWFVAMFYLLVFCLIDVRCSRFVVIVLCVVCGLLVVVWCLLFVVGCGSLFVLFVVRCS